jgi:hypothetical protein
VLLIITSSLITKGRKGQYSIQLQSMFENDALHKNTIATTIPPIMSGPPVHPNSSTNLF